MQYSENNLNTFYQLLAKASNTVIVEKNHYKTLQATEGTFPNFHFEPKLTTENGKTIIESIRAKSKDGYPTVIKTNPLTTDQITYELLNQHTSFKGSWTAMSLEIKKLKLIQPIENLSIRKITDQEDIDDWCKIVEAGLMSGNPISHKMFYRLSQETNTFFYLAYFDNQPVATAMTILEKEEIGIYLIAILEEFRRKGIGQAITTIALSETAKIGGELVHLQATKLGEPVYRKIGFQKMMDIAVYRI